MLHISASDAKRLGIQVPKTRRTKAPAPKASGSHLEAEFLHHRRTIGKRMGIPEPTPQYRFDPERGWLLDFAWIPALVALEIDGGTRIAGGGRHNRADGYARDCEKLNAAALAGWLVLRYTGEMMSGDPIGMMRQIAEALRSRSQE